MPIAEVRVKNLKQTMDLLKAYAPDQAKEINKRITTEANKIRDRARDYMPNVALSNWNNWPDHASEGYVGSVVKKRLKTTRANARPRGQIVSNYIGVVSADAAGAIFQTTGKGSSSDIFVENILNKHTSYRGLWRAFDELKTEVQPAIMAAVEDAQQLVNTKLNQLGGE
ncbi:MAG TPA: hypothetical protein VLA24_16895 [Pseudomonadales bacterium]|nr:hypothetical protein [Pseudomonadales bacterium]